MSRLLEMNMKDTLLMLLMLLLILFAAVVDAEVYSDRNVLIGEFDFTGDGQLNTVVLQRKAVGLGGEENTGNLVVDGKVIDFKIPPLWYPALIPISDVDGDGAFDLMGDMPGKPGKLKTRIIYAKQCLAVSDVYYQPVEVFEDPVTEFIWAHEGGACSITIVRPDTSKRTFTGGAYLNRDINFCRLTDPVWRVLQPGVTNWKVPGKPWQCVSYD
jgi:hypothetical protein